MTVQQKLLELAKKVADGQLDVDMAREAIREWQENLATDWEREKADEDHGVEGVVEIDAGAQASRCEEDGGFWVQAWVWVES